MAQLYFALFDFFFLLPNLISSPETLYFIFDLLIFVDEL